MPHEYGTMPVDWPPPKPAAPPGSMIDAPGGKDEEMAALRREVEQLRVAANPAKVEAVGRLVASATRLVQVERDDARKRAERAEAAIARVRELHYPVHGGRWCNACTRVDGGHPASYPCPTIRALDGETP